MKLKVVLPWILVLGLSAAVAAVYLKSSAKDAQLTSLREESKELEQLRADAVAAQEKAQVPDDQVMVSRKDKEELIRLRGEIGKLRTENLKLTKDLTTSQGRAEAARSQAEAAAREVENARAQTSAAMIANRANTRDGQRDACINNLRQIDAAKQQWALENNKQVNSVPTPQDIAPYLKNSVIPTCSSGGIYTANPVGHAPTCSIPGHVFQ
ncbi:MAG: hypothetical protein H7Y43_04125 [Akkermansiaceae bacterium]|nr:hypothetical protein [Verrucomicrobiales bacterium]